MGRRQRSSSRVRAPRNRTRGRMMLTATLESSLDDEEAVSDHADTGGGRGTSAFFGASLSPLAVGRGGDERKLSGCMYVCVRARDSEKIQDTSLVGKPMFNVTEREWNRRIVLSTEERVPSEDREENMIHIYLRVSRVVFVLSSNPRPSWTVDPWMPFLCGISSLVALARLAILDQGNEILSRRHTRCPWHGSLEPPRPRTAHRTSTQSFRAHTQSTCSIYVSHPGYFWSQLRGALPPRHIPGSRDHFARERTHHIEFLFGISTRAAMW